MTDIFDIWDEYASALEANPDLLEPEEKMDRLLWSIVAASHGIQPELYPDGTGARTGTRYDD